MLPASAPHLRFMRHKIVSVGWRCSQQGFRRFKWKIHRDKRAYRELLQQSPPEDSGGCNYTFTCRRMAQSSSLPWGYITSDTAVKTQEKLFLANSSPRKWLALHSEYDPSPLTVQTPVKVTPLNHFITTYSVEIRQAKRSATSGEQFRFDSRACGVAAGRAVHGPDSENLCQNRELSTVLSLTWLLEYRTVHCADSQIAVGTRNCPWCWFWASRWYPGVTVMQIPERWKKDWVFCKTKRPFQRACLLFQNVFDTFLILHVEHCWCDSFNWRQHGFRD